LNDKRRRIGKLLCIDHSMNITLADVAEELLINAISSINKKLRFYRRKKSKYMNMSKTKVSMKRQRRILKIINLTWRH